MNPIYLDHASTTPALPEVVESMRPYWTATFGNPASAHRFGQQARQALETARETVAELLGADPDEVFFTSGATEANNLAIFGLAGPDPGRLVTSPIEHPSVAEPLLQLSKQGFQLDSLTVAADGQVRPESLQPLLCQPVRLLTVMLVNNETGVMQPILELAKVAQGKVVHFHCDGVQAIGKMPVSFQELGATTFSLSAHKFQGPRGIGALLVRKGSQLRPLLFGGHQQLGLRPGTEPVALAVGLAKALELACREMATRNADVRRLRDRFLRRLSDRAAPIRVNGDPVRSLPHIVNVSFPGCPSDVLLMKLDLAGVACSTGAACSSGSLLPSPTLRAMGCPAPILTSAMRFSFIHLMPLSDIDLASDRIIAAVAELRRAQLAQAY